MKKYWILIVISIAMVASIGTFYMQSALATGNMPKVTIEKKQGDDKEIGSLSMSGYYYGELNYVGEEFEIGSEGIEYSKNKSLFERVDRFYGSPRIKELQKEYRNFMRGKYSDIYSYFEDEKYLVYADVSYKNPYTVSSGFEFKIAILDKKTNKTTMFEHLVPNSGDFWHLYTLNVQLVDDQLKVITRNNVREGDSEEIRLYTFDVEEETLVNDEVILATEGAEDERIEITRLDADDPTRDNQHLVLDKKVIGYVEVEDEGYFEEVVGEELVVYDLDSDISKIINLESFTELGHPEYVNGSNVSFIDFTENGSVKIATYDIESEQIVGNFDVTLTSNTEGKTMAFNDGKLYLVDSYINFDTAAFLTVIHLENGDTLFEGEITRKDQIGTLSIDDLQFK